MRDELNAAALSEIASFLNNEHQDSLLAIGRGLVAADTVWAELSHVANAFGCIPLVFHTFPIVDK